ncbi:hypothetical protein NDU88_003617 [Pleurodeles waltl]|uniref:Uncharacterized protein n=1 Tax=Pleurodeles waltl TaxID=8319 RepID=A0AAV7UD54_PLEWA|nr:hypothetical protein NDU88_003617 [Pleurodeles waltl]
MGLQYAAQWKREAMCFRAAGTSRTCLRLVAAAPYAKNLRLHIPETTEVAASTESTEDTQTHGKHDGNPLQIEPTLSMVDVVDELKGTRAELAAKIDSIAIDVNLLRTDLSDVAERERQQLKKM